MNFKPLSKREAFIASKIVSMFYTVHKELGLDLIERIFIFVS